MPLQTFRTICAAIIVAIGLMPIERSMAASPSQSAVLTARRIAQAPTPEQLDRQREAERVLKDGEQLRQDVKNNNNNRDIERQVGEQVDKVRGSGSDPQQVREADAELTRLRQQNQQNNRPNYYYDPFYPYYTTPAPIIFTPIYSTEPTNPTTDRNTSRRENNTPSNTRILGSIGLKDGAVSPGIGIRYNNIGFEIGGIFNQDSLPRSVNNFSLPSNFFFTDLGLKKLSPQWGADVLGFVDVAPRVAIYGSVGVYFQSQARIAQSLATSELYKQTDETNVTGAVGGGVNYSLSEGVSLGLGYHSLRGITARLGISF